MKNTKNMLLTGVTLAITLFASIQLSAMAPEKKVNPHLEDYQRQFTELDIQGAKQTIERHYRFIKHLGLNDPKNVTLKKIYQDIENQKQRIKCLENLYYGNKAYTHDEYIKYKANCPGY